MAERTSIALSSLPGLGLAVGQWWIIRMSLLGDTKELIHVVWQPLHE